MCAWKVWVKHHCVTPHSKSGRFVESLDPMLPRSLVISVQGCSQRREHGCMSPVVIGKIFLSYVFIVLILVLVCYVCFIVFL